MNLLRTVVGDALFGLRMFARKPGFAAVAVLALALGIAVNTAMFSVVYAALLEPLPYPDPDRLVTITASTGHGRGSTLRPPDFLALKREARSFEALHASWWRPLTLGIGEGAEAASAQLVTPGYLSMMGGGFALGRDFLPEEGDLGRDRVAIVSHRFWMDRLGGDPAAIGRSLRLDRAAHTIVGVQAPASERVWQPALLLPLAFTPEQLEPDFYSLVYVTGRLGKGMSPEAASAELTVVWARMGKARAALGPRIVAEPIQTSFLTPDRARVLWLLMGAVASVLLIACANVAHLLLAQAEARRREVAVRTSLGASRGRIFGQFLAESAALALLGALTGTALAFAIVRAAAPLVPHFGIPPSALQLSVPVLAFTAAITVLSTLAFGSIPAWRATQADPIGALKDGGYTTVGSRGSLWQRGFVAAEFALALPLLAGGGLLVHHLAQLTRVDLGLRTDRLLTFRLPGPATSREPEMVDAFYRRVEDALSTLPGVATVGVSSWPPLQGGGFSRSFEVLGRQTQGPAQGANFNMVTQGYFPAYGIEIVRGRGFTADDRAGAVPVAVVNAEFARRFLEGVDPLQQRLVIQEQPIAPKIGASPPPPREWRIVGVSRDVRHAGPRGAFQPEIDVPLSQSPWPETVVAVRTHDAPDGHQRPIATALTGVEPDLAMSDVRTMDQRLHERMAGARFNAALFGTFAALGLALAGVGIYAVTAFAVAQRTREIGLRMALGADRTRVLWAVVAEGMTTVLAGAAFGVSGAFAALRMVRGFVPGTDPADPFPLAVITVLLMATALAACVVPARRAARVDPLVALRED